MSVWVPLCTFSNLGRSCVWAHEILGSMPLARRRPARFCGQITSDQCRPNLITFWTYGHAQGGTGNPSLKFMYYPGQKNWDRHARACHAPEITSLCPLARGCPNFFGQGSTWVVFTGEQKLRRRRLDLTMCFSLWKTAGVYHCHRTYRFAVPFAEYSLVPFFRLSSRTHR